MSRAPDPDTPDHGATLRGWRIPSDGLAWGRWRCPQLGGVITERLILGGRASRRSHEDRSDPRHVLVARPDPPLLGLFRLSDAAQGPRLVAAARDELRPVLAAWRASALEYPEPGAPSGPARRWSA